MTRALAGGLAAILLFACGPGESHRTTPDAGPQAFVAVQGNFACYRTWDSFDGGTDAFDGIGVSGALRTLYINRRPPGGSAAFPLGTIIVKDVVGQQTFAMAKRGGHFNPDAGDWEWFELTTAVDDPPSACAPTISWRGQAPPAGTVYGGQLAECDGCHSVAADNDFVAGTALLLSNF